MRVEETSHVSYISARSCCIVNKSSRCNYLYQKNHVIPSKDNTGKQRIYTLVACTSPHQNTHSSFPTVCSDIQEKDIHHRKWDTVIMDQQRAKFALMPLTVEHFYLFPSPFYLIDSAIV